jgi:hypothetical protein
VSAPAVPALIAAHAGRLRLAAVTRLLQTAAAGREPGIHSRRIPALAGCYHACADAGTPFVFGWLRPEHGGPITVLTTTPVTGAGMIYPPSATGQLLDAGAAAGLLSATSHWARLRVGFDALVTADDRHEPSALEDALLDTWTEPFAWLVHAAPLTAAQIAEEAATVAEEERQARSRTDSPAYQVRADRACARHRELRAGESTGGWQVHLLAGATTGPAAVTLAGLLAAAIDLTPHGYILTPSGLVASLDAAVADTSAATVTGTPVLAALAQPPAGEVPGVSTQVRPTFAVTPPTTGVGLRLGRMLDRSGHAGAELLLPGSSLTRHTFVTGATGSGKTTTIQHLLSQATEAGIPWLVIEPAKVEYRDRIPAMVLRVGDLDTPAVGINPLQPADGFPLRTHADMVKALLVAAFRADEPFPQILAAAIETAYHDAGWDLTLGTPRGHGIQPRWPTLADLRTAAQTATTAAGYGRDIEANVQGFMRVRLASLSTGTAGTFLTARDQLDMDRLLRGNVILELEDIGDDTDKAVVMGAFLLRLTQQLRLRHRQQPTAGRLRHITVVEEAHRLLRRPDHYGPAASAVETFAALLAEIRAYGEGLIIADQIPAKLIPDVIKNTAIKIMHRLPGRDDRDAVGATINLTDDQSTYLVSLPAGAAAVATDGMQTPVLVHVPQTPQRPAGAAPTTETVAGDGVPTARELAYARALAQTQPSLAIWADLAVLAHLLALPAPTPRPALATWLGQQPDEVLQLAIGELVDASVDARTTAIATSHSPAAFTAHVTEDLNRQLQGQPSCPHPAERWWTTAYRYNPIRWALLQAVHTDRHATRHPDSHAWEQLHSHPIPGHTAAEQLAAVDVLSAQAEQRVDPDAVVHGTPARLPALIGASPGTARWAAEVVQHLTALHNPGGWANTYLTRPRVAAANE